MQNLAQTVKTGLFRSKKTGKCFNLKIDTFKEGIWDQLLSIDVRILLKFEVNIVQNGPLS